MTYNATHWYDLDAEVIAGIFAGVQLDGQGTPAFRANWDWKTQAVEVKNG